MKKWKDIRYSIDVRRKAGRNDTNELLTSYVMCFIYVLCM